MILAAGIGTRLRPLTSIRPKALMPVANQPVLGATIEYLKKFGVTQIAVNAHHLSDHLVKYLDGGKPFGLKIEVLVEAEILGTGGGIKNAAGFWGVEPFLVINSDIITDLDLSAAIIAHENAGNKATLVLHDYRPFNKIKVNENSEIVEIPHGFRPENLAFTGIHIIDPELINFIPEGVYYDIVDCYRQLIGSGIKIGAYVAQDFYWRDIGTVGDYMLANKEALKGIPFLIPSSCVIGEGVITKDWAVIGEDSLVEEGSEVTRSVLWDQVRIRKGVRIIDSIVTSSKNVNRDMVSEIF